MIKTTIILLSFLSFCLNGQDIDKKIELIDLLTTKNNFHSAVEVSRSLLNSCDEKLSSDQIKTVLRNYIFCLNNLAHQSQGKRDYYLADLYLKQVLNYQKKYSYYPSDLNEYTYFLIGSNYFHSEDYLKAQIYLKKSLDLHKIPIDQFSADVFLYLAYSYQYSKEYEKARMCFEKSINIFSTLKNKQSEYAKSCCGYGLFFYYQGDYEKSESYLLKAYDILKNCNNPIEFANVLNHLGFFYKKTLKYSDGIKYFQKTLSLFDSTIDTKNFYSNPVTNNTSDQFLYALRYKAHSFYQLYKYQTNSIKDLEAAFNTFELTFDLIGRNRGESFSEESNFFFASSFKETVNNAIITAYELYKLKMDDKYLRKMFEYSEMAKSSLLLKTISGALKSKTEGVPADLTKKERKLNYEIAVLRALSEKKSEGSPGETEYLLFEKFYELEMVREEIKKHIKNDSEKYNLPFVSIDKIQNQMESGTILIEYCLTDSVLFAFSLDKQSLTVHTVNIDSAFFNDIADLNFIIRNFKVNFSDSNSFAIFAGISNRLYKKLILPVEKRINGKRLIIVQDTRFNQLPFQVLLRDVSKGLGFRSAGYLIKFYPVSYEYSAYLSSFRTSTPHNNRFVAIAPDYMKTRIRENPFYPELDSVELPPLKYNRKEAKEIAALMQGISLTGADAGEQNVKDALKNSRFVHLSGHCLVNRDESLFSAFVLTGKKDSLNDGLLYAYEVYNSETTADMVVLSGCNTGSGMVMEGEGVLGLARAFLQSGAKSVVVSLWNEDDKTGFKILNSFYRYLLNGHEKDIAMQNAVNDYLARSESLRCHPYFWAGISVVGDTSPVVLQNPNRSNFPLNYLLLIILPVLVISFWYFKKRRKDILAKR